MIILTATQDDCLADMLGDAIAHRRDDCEDAPAGVCDDCLSLIQAYRNLAGDLGLKCPDCQGTGIVDVETDCGGCSGYPGITHEPACGVEPCPRGCEVPAS